MEEKNVTYKKIIKKGLNFGQALAIAVSYMNWHSLLWAIIHGWLGWLYIIYYVIRY